MFFVILVCGASLLAVAGIVVAAKMPRDVEMYTAWKWAASVALATTVIFAIVMFYDSLWWVVPTVLFAVATWNLSGVLARVEAERTLAAHQ